MGRPHCCRWCLDSCRIPDSGYGGMPCPRVRAWAPRPVPALAAGSRPGRFPPSGDLAPLPPTPRSRTVRGRRSVWGCLPRPTEGPPRSLGPRPDPGPPGTARSVPLPWLRTRPRPRRPGLGGSSPPGGWPGDAPRVPPCTRRSGDIAFHECGPHGRVVVYGGGEFGGPAGGARILCQCIAPWRPGRSPRCPVGPAPTRSDPWDCRGAANPWRPRMGRSPPRRRRPQATNSLGPDFPALALSPTADRRDARALMWSPGMTLAMPTWCPGRSGWPAEKAAGGAEGRPGPAPPPLPPRVVGPAWPGPAPTAARPEGIGAVDAVLVPAARRALGLPWLLPASRPLHARRSPGAVGSDRHSLRRPPRMTGWTLHLPMSPGSPTPPCGQPGPPAGWRRRRMAWGPVSAAGAPCPWRPA